METPSAPEARSVDPPSLRLPREALTADPGFWEAARLRRAAVLLDVRLVPARRTAREGVARPDPERGRWTLRRLRSWLAGASP